MITTCMDRGSLHIGYGAENSKPNQLGTNIDVYRNFITRFISRILGRSMTIQINGKERCLNKKSLFAHFNAAGLKNINFKALAAGDFTYDSIIKNASSLEVSRVDYAENLSMKKRTNLFKKMINQLANNNTDAVKKLMRKGAYTDKQFFIVHNDCKIDIKLANGSCVNFYEKFLGFTPLSYAAYRGNIPLALFIYNFKGKQHSDSDVVSTYQYGYKSSPTLVSVQKVKIQDQQDPTPQQKTSISFKGLEDILQDVISF